MKVGEVVWRVRARVRLSVIRGIVAVRRTLRLTRVFLRCTHCFSNMSAHARIVMRTMTRRVRTRAVLPIMLSYFARRLIQGEFTVLLSFLF